MMEEDEFSLKSFLVRFDDIQGLVGGAVVADIDGPVRMSLVDDGIELGF